MTLRSKKFSLTRSFFTIIIIIMSQLHIVIKYCYLKEFDCIYRQLNRTDDSASLNDGVRTSADKR